MLPHKWKCRACTAEGKIQTARLQKTGDNTPKCTIIIFNSNLTGAPYWSSISGFQRRPQAGQEHSEFISAMTNELCTTNTSQITEWLQKFRLKITCVGNYQKQSGRFSIKRKKSGKQLCLVYTEKKRENREALLCSASPSWEDRLAPASGRTLFGFHSYSKNGFVWREMPRCS